MTEDSFGFTAANRVTADKLKSIKPSLPQTNTGELERTDRATEALGFVSREFFGDQGSSTATGDRANRSN